MWIPANRLAKCGRIRLAEAVSQRLARWRGRTALVTGASSGIGAAIARELAVGLGMRVAAVARRKARLDALASAVVAAGGELVPVVADVSDTADIDAAFAEARKHLGGVDLLVNNAGVANMAEIMDGKPADWSQSLDINVVAPAYCAQLALTDMGEREDTQIINISSVYAHRDQVPNFALYQASKAAVRALTNTLRAEIANRQLPVRVGMISPGMVATEFRAQATDGRIAYESYFEHYEPLLPEDIVDAVMYMLSTRPHIQVQDILLSPLGQGL